MAFLSAFLSLISRKLGDLLQMLFGWSISGLFGRLPSKKQNALSVALILSILWPMLVVGCFLPKVAAWTIAFVPLHEWLGATALRVIWIALAAIAPIVVGLLIAWIAPRRKQRGGFLRTVLAGYPLTVGLFLSFLLTFLVVPIVKIISMVRRWEDEHVYLQVQEGAYLQVLQQLSAACQSSGLAVTERSVPGAMQAPLRVLRWFARSAVDPIVASNPRMLTSSGLQLFLYPSDLLIRGRIEHVHRVRAAIVREMMQAPAFLTEDVKAQALEEQLTKLWQLVRSSDDGDEDAQAAFSNRTADSSASLEPSRAEIHRVVQEGIPILTQYIHELNVPYADWVLLYTNVNHLALVVSGEPQLVNTKNPDANFASADIDQHQLANISADLSVLDLMKSALKDSQALLKTELALMRHVILHPGNNGTSHFKRPL